MCSRPCVEQSIVAAYSQAKQSKTGSLYYIEPPRVVGTHRCEVAWPVGHHANLDRHKVRDSVKPLPMLS